jgi:hypothetical protein
MNLESHDIVSLQQKLSNTFKSTYIKQNLSNDNSRYYALWVELPAVLMDCTPLQRNMWNPLLIQVLTHLSAVFAINIVWRSTVVHHNLSINQWSYLSAKRLANVKPAWIKQAHRGTWQRLLWQPHFAYQYCISSYLKWRIYCWIFKTGKAITSLMLAEFVKSITNRSIPRPWHKVPKKLVKQATMFLIIIKWIILRTTAN